MRNIGALIVASVRTVAEIIKRFTSLHIVICRKCSDVLHNAKGATEISRGLCFKCRYFALGGTIPRLPRLTDFEIYKNLFSKHQIVHDNIWEGQTIHKGLIKNGQIARNARDGSRSLSPDERHIIGTVREVARQYGYSWLYINDTEMTGWGYFPHGGK